MWVARAIAAGARASTGKLGSGTETDGGAGAGTGSTTLEAGGAGTRSGASRGARAGSGGGMPADACGITDVVEPEAPAGTGAENAR